MSWPKLILRNLTVLHVSFTTSCFLNEEFLKTKVKTTGKMKNAYLNWGRSLYFLKRILPISRSKLKDKFFFEEIDHLLKVHDSVQYTAECSRGESCGIVVCPGLIGTKIGCWKMTRFNGGQWWLCTKKKVTWNLLGWQPRGLWYDLLKKCLSRVIL